MDKNCLLNINNIDHLSNNILIIEINTIYFCMFIYHD
jgi:hypothetical protein